MDNEIGTMRRFSGWMGSCLLAGCCVFLCVCFCVCVYLFLLVGSVFGFFMIVAVLPSELLFLFLPDTALTLSCLFFSLCANVWALRQ